MANRIVWRPAARDDLLALYDWIAGQADAATAFDYASRMEAHLAPLIDFPMTGTPRDDLFPGLRTLTYRRRTIVAYRIVGADIEIVRLAHGGRDLGQLFVAEED